MKQLAKYYTISNIILATLVSPINSLAQCPVASISIPVSACSNEQIILSNLSTNTDSTYWDFCSNDLNTFPSIGLQESAIPGLVFSSGIKILEESGNYYGFVVSRNNHKLFKLIYGNDLNNIPTIMDLGDLGGLLNFPEGIDILKFNGEWIGVIGYLNMGGSLTSLNFGSSLENSPLASNIGSPVTGRIRNLILTTQNGNLIMVAPSYNSNSIVAVNYKNSITDPVDPLDIHDSGPLTDVNLPIGLGIINDCGNWKGILTSYTTIFKTVELDFGNSLLNTPSIIGSHTITSLSNPLRVSLIQQGNDIFSVISNEFGPLTILNYGQLNGSPPLEISNTGLPQLNDLYIKNLEGARFGIGINSTTNLTTIEWKSDCGQSMEYSNSFEPTGLSYATPGNYEIELTALNTASGYSTTISKPITISPSQAPQLTTQITGKCLSNPINFDGQQLSGDIASWNWDFGDGVGSSILQNDSYTYAAAGEYQVRLSVTDANGCNNLYIDTARVYEEPIPAFTIPLGNLCMNNPIDFTNTSTGETGPEVSWTWDFNGEGTSTDKEPIFTFLTPGSKTVTLTSSIPGCANVTQQTITIEEAPTTTFSFNNACLGQTTTFNDLTTGNNLTSWNWDFGDGNNSILQNPTHEYLIPGKYVVTLAVSNNLGCTTTKVDTVYNHALPVVNFTNDLPCSSSPIQFTDQSTVQDANIVAWEWDFGDGTTASERNPQHLYGQTGDFIVKLKAYSQYGCVDSLSTTVSVIQGPEVDFSWDKGCEGEATIFEDLTNSFGIPITNWSWLINGTIFNDQNPQYTFSSSGTYIVQLTVTANNLCAQTLPKEIIVEKPPETNFIYYESCTSDTVTFVDTTPVLISTRDWRIDGVSTGADSILKEPLLPDTYMISLAAISTAGCSNIKMQDIDISGSISAQFKASTNYGAAPLTVQFNNQSNGTSAYEWQFGDDGGATSTDPSPQFTFSDLGEYTVKLIAFGGENCSDTTIQTIEVVELIHDLVIEAITPLENGQLAISMRNNGSATYQPSNSKLIFTLDNSAEITESLDSVLYPHKSMNYVPTFSLGSTGNSKVVCVNLQYNDGQSLEVLDKNCLNLNSQAIIADAYPNPATDYINLSVVLPTPGSIKITLIDRNGAVLLNESYDSSVQGLNDYAIDTTPYRSGLYIIKVETENEVKEMKVVINK